MTKSEKELIKNYGYTLKEIAKTVKLEYNSYRKSTARERYSSIILDTIMRERNLLKEMKEKIINLLTN